MPDAPLLAKPRLRAIALRCVEPGGPFVLGQIYYATRGHRNGADCTLFDVLVEGEVRVEYDTRFTPCNADHWYLFSRAQRRRFDIRLPYERYLPVQSKPARRPSLLPPVWRGTQEVRL